MKCTSQVCDHFEHDPPLDALKELISGARLIISRRNWAFAELPESPCCRGWSGRPLRRKHTADDGRLAGPLFDASHASIKSRGPGQRPESQTSLQPACYRHSTGTHVRFHRSFETSASVGGIKNEARSATTSSKGGGDSTSRPLRRKALH